MGMKKVPTEAEEEVEDRINVEEKRRRLRLKKGKEEEI